MAITQADFAFVRKFVHDRAAIVLEDGKEYLVESRLSALARREGIASVDEVVRRLRGSPGGPLPRMVVEAMTTNESSFFRDVNPFTALKETVIPELLRLRAAEKTLQIWSCASSSGQEPYSLAMLLHENFPELFSWNVRILATDISSEMVARTKNGKFSQLEVNRGLPAPLLVKYFEKHGLEWQAREPLRRMLDTRELNLAGNWAGIPRVDLVMLRNVLIYFDMETKRGILGKVRQLLRPGGCMFLGTAESTMNLDDKYTLQRANGAVYYKVRS